MIIWYKFCKECYQYSAPHCFRGRCLTHANEVCSACWDRFALGRFNQGRVSATAQCIQCARQISERELENRLSTPFYLKYVGMKYNMAVARMKEPKAAQKPVEKDVVDDFVMVEKDSAQTDKADHAEDGMKEESKVAKRPAELEDEDGFVVMKNCDSQTDEVYYSEDEAQGSQGQSCEIM
ncbi:hypothetical protein BST61_g1443 [Cercospora zeina]